MRFQSSACIEQIFVELSVYWIIIASAVYEEIPVYSVGNLQKENQRMIKRPRTRLLAVKHSQSILASISPCIPGTSQIHF